MSLICLLFWVCQKSKLRSWPMNKVKHFCQFCSKTSTLHNTGELSVQFLIFQCCRWKKGCSQWSEEYSLASPCTLCKFSVVYTCIFSFFFSKRPLCSYSCFYSVMFVYACVVRGVSVCQCDASRSKVAEI